MTSSGPAGHHAIVSKMARKYSHHSMPDPSQIHSTDPDDVISGNASICSGTGSRIDDLMDEKKESLDTASTLPSASFVSPPMNAIPSAAEVDEEMLSETQTMISHHSIASRRTITHRKSSSSSRSKQVHFSPIDEIRGYQ